MAKTATILRELVEVLRQPPVDVVALIAEAREECASAPLPDTIATGRLRGSKRLAYIDGFRAAWALFAAKIREKS